jgi:hypothetical protein
MFLSLVKNNRLIARFFLLLFYLECIGLSVQANTIERKSFAWRDFSALQTGQALFENSAGPDFISAAVSSSKNVVEKVEKSGSSGIAAPRGKYTTGPTQPEMQSFQSVNANNMVDLFSGDFSYNIPLLDVGGYPVNLHYQGGISMDQEASWVGLGWNINPGAVTRNMRGLPDDFQGESVLKTVSMKPNRTIGLSTAANAEVAGLSKLGGLTLEASIGVFHNNYKGWGLETGVNAMINAGSASKGGLTASLGITNNSQDGLSISPSMGYRLGSAEQGTTGSVTIGTSYNSRIGIQSLQISGQVRRTVYDYYKVAHSIGSGVTSFISFAKPSFTPKIQTPFTSTQYTFTVKLGGEIKPFHPNLYFKGYGSVQKIEKEDQDVVVPAYGYLYYEKAGVNKDVLLDFNREKETSFRQKTPHIAVPIYTYDTYTISGEGTGGMFRPYRGDIGFVYDNVVSTRSNSLALSVDLGYGDLFHGGTDVNSVSASTRTGPWLGDNFFKDVSRFKSADSNYENVYFKNPGEKGSVDTSYLNMIGDENLVRVDLNPINGQNLPSVWASQTLSLFQNSKLTGKKTVSTNSLRLKRDKRTQVISFLTASEAQDAGFTKKIRSFNINSFPSTTCTTNYTEHNRVDEYKRSHHVSEITVLNPDGRRYIYGIPVYNLEQSDVTMATQGGKGNNSTGLVRYQRDVDNTKNNNNGIDGYFNLEALPSHSHSFLLSGIVSPDYVDITGDGITEDDNGDAIKFNYSRVYGPENPFRWRAPYRQDSASYNEGLKTDNRDDKGSYSYGTKEIWYLNSIESKTMIATFVLDTDSIRKDAYGVIDENGGRSGDQKLYRLKQINLYTKADFLKNGSNAKPIKSVHLEYNYELCKKNPSSIDQNTGKLTLKKVWFSYNKNNKGKLNPYQFTYAKNVDHNTKSYDRWGNYKDPADNPGTASQPVSNADYPYSLQSGTKSASGQSWDSAKAAANAGLWSLSEIKLPSGGKIKVTYESDDYAYVQNKRAMQFFSLAGFGSSSTAAVNNLNLYEPNKNGNDYRFVFINVSEQVTDRADVYRKYLEGVSKLYFKVLVKMPTDKWGSGYEYVPVYADIEDYGVKGSPSDKRIWIKLAPVTSTESPIATSAIQFLRLNLPSKAFPGSEPGNSLDLRTVVSLLATVSDNIRNTIRKFEKNARTKNWCNRVDLDRSFVRLNVPSYKKLGGGYRVKKVEIEDNWDAMTGQQMKKTVYGQEYDYSTVIPINGIPTRISSGVATYEPGTGNDENPFHVPFRLYSEKEGIMAPTNFLYVEEPFAETFFPAPMVGYSKVKVQTINKNQKSATGFEETEFYTARDFPTLVEMTPLDNESKKTFNPKINNTFKFNAKNYVTLSQGFKVELNDMNGKVKSQASYSQNDIKNPISYTFNYYRLQNDDAGQKKISNTVSLIDSATGVVRSGQIGKEVEIMVDVREQVSRTFGSSIEFNGDLFSVGPWPFLLPSMIPLPTSEENRYRSIAILKIVNKYGLLDSVIHIEKGSRVATRNLVYDGETGDVLVSQTNNEFDDPIFNMSYPAHWAYSGMGPAYKNIGAAFRKVRFQQGRMYYNNRDSFPVSRFFESGDELLVYAKHLRLPTGFDTCQDGFYLFYGPVKPVKVWVIDASKGREKDRGLFFIDKDGKPYSAAADLVKIIRSGKRNMASTPVGSVTSLASPIRTVNGVQRIMLDTASQVIAASAASFKDFWKVDSTTYAKDTVIIGSTRVDTTMGTSLYPIDSYSIYNYKTRRGSRRLIDDNAYKAFEASSWDQGNNRQDFERKSWMRFDVSSIPKGAVIKSATLKLKHHYEITHENRRTSNSAYIQRGTGRWIREALGTPLGAENYITMDQYFREYGLGKVDVSTRAAVPATAPNSSSTQDHDVAITSLLQGMVDDYYSKGTAASVMIRLINPGGVQNGNWSRLAYHNNREIPSICWGGSKGSSSCMPVIVFSYYIPCDNSTKPVYATTPVPGYYCYSNPKDSFLCKPNIVDSAVNPYRWGILGNWRMERAYTYYDRRKESNPMVPTNIRKDGVIKDFAPYWSFTTANLLASNDSSRWVWNSEMTLFNQKGYEIENRDPLDRYNSGQYGYNQTLPVAVAQNSKNRNMMFDGFEDYDYRTDTCRKCPSPRFVDLTTGGGTRIDTLKHSGKYSLRINGNSNASVPVKIVSKTQDSLTIELSVDVDSAMRVDTVIVPAGTGARGYYTANGGYDSSRVDPVIDTNWEKNSPFPNWPRDWFNVTWRAKVQPIYTDYYNFYTNSDDGAGLYILINGVWENLIKQPSGDYRDGDRVPPDGPVSKPVLMTAGTLYEILLVYRERKERAKIKLSWSSQRVSRQVIPASQLYLPETTQQSVAGTKRLDTSWCVRLKNPGPIRVTNNRFSPIAGTKIVVSAWVREDGICTGSSYNNVSMQLSFNSGSPALVTLQPRGPIIDGWQRIEDTLTIPASATSANLIMRSTSSTATFFDDIRIHPFNANMKSFVYNPVNLRLMAELDENNYATFYEYDDDGTLIRVKKETERGIKTIKETRSALLKEQQ